MARFLVKQKVAKAILQASGDLPDDGLPDGHMRLYSFYKPSLEAGLYAIEAKQTVHVAGTDHPLLIWNYAGAEDKTNSRPVEKQLFSVAAPQFSIDPKLINTYYPPTGHQDEGRILPHIVFNDPHVPWLRRAGILDPNVKDPIDPDRSLNPDRHGKMRNMVPWMALVVFDSQDLLIDSADATATGLSGVASYNPSKLPADGAFPMTVGDYFRRIPKNRIYYEAGYPDAEAASDLGALRDSMDMTSVIFPTKAQVQNLFGAEGEPEVLENQKFLAHVRHVRTDGFPDAGVQEEGYYSVVISSRTGQVNNTLPTPQVVHLVSLEHYDSTTRDPLSPAAKLGDTDRIGLISLYSWVYTCIPEAVNFVDTMKDLVQNKQPLGPPAPLLRDMQDSINKQPTTTLQRAAQILHDRLSRSYTISRWRAATGEETVAFNRGPLVPVPTPTVPTKDTSWPAFSMSGKDYQIFDTAVGIMDLTYSSAWSLGKLAAISDSPFNSALMRFRSLVWQKAASKTRMLVNGMPPAAKVLASSLSTISNVHAIQPATFSGNVARVIPHSTDSVAPPLSHPKIAPIFSKALVHAIDAAASITDGEELYSDFHLDSAANSDWELIHGWISDCLYLKNIPAHYLFPEPSHINGQQESSAPSTLPNLPPEALRFFFIDHSWLDCFLDGALSCANHLEPKCDTTRLRIKDIYNFYLSSPIHGLENVTPPIPRYGFVIRSSVVKSLPDLKITVTCWLSDPADRVWKKDPKRDPVVRLSKMDDFTILCLLDCMPEEVYEITFSQPPHQQRYAMGLKAVQGGFTAELPVKMLYTSRKDAPEGTGPAGEWKPLPDTEQPTDQNTYWDLTSRCIRPLAIANSVTQALVKSQQYKGMYDDVMANSCVVGLELNDPSYSFIVGETNNPPARTTPFDSWTRSLWTGDGSKPVSYQAKAMVSTDDLPASPLIALKTVHHSQISLPKPLPSNAQLPKPAPAPRLHASRVVESPAAASHASQARGRVVAAAPGSQTIDGPQFTLIVHPDYRPPPPTPYRPTEGGIIYAPMDFIPTDTVYMYDLIIAIRRKQPDASPNYQLVELDVEFPISDGTDARDSNGNIREPLLPVGGYTGPGVRMTNNARFVPTLYMSIDSGKKPVLGIKLISRSGTRDATITITNDGRTTEAGVRLAECPIAKIVDNSRGVQVAQVDGQGKGTLKSGREARGICEIVLKEVYLMSDGTRKTIITDGRVRAGKNVGIPLLVLKRAKGDVDLDGHAV